MLVESWNTEQSYFNCNLGCFMLASRWFPNEVRWGGWRAAIVRMSGKFLWSTGAGLISARWATNEGNKNTAGTNLLKHLDCCISYYLLYRPTAVRRGGWAGQYMWTLYQFLNANIYIQLGIYLQQLFTVVGPTFQGKVLKHQGINHLTIKVHVCSEFMFHQ